MSKDFVARLFLWLLFITTLEVWFTATIERILSRGSVVKVPWFSLQGRSSILQLGFAFTLAWVLDGFFALYASLPSVPFQNPFVAAAVVMALIFAVELGAGMVLNRMLKLSLWDYSAHRIFGRRFHYLGQISGWYIPGWFVAGLILWSLHAAIGELAPALVKAVEVFWSNLTSRF
jgi:hypothetical protein